MRKNIFLKSLLRQPIQTLFLVLLVGVISFAFVSRAAEYLIIQRETDRLSRFYQSVGAIESIIPGGVVGRMAEAAEILAACDYVDFVDVQRIISGTMPDIFNTSFGGQVGLDGSRSLTYWMRISAQPDFDEVIFMLNKYIKKTN